MSLLQRFGFGRPRGEEALLEEEVTALQAALAKCKDVATRWKRTRWELVVAVGVLMLALGFVLGVYSEPLKQALGLTSQVADVDAGYAAFQKGDYETALRLLRPLAENGDARAQSTLGLLYLKGSGVPQDNREAAEWFRQAGEQGDAVAQSNLGVMYSEGQGVPQNSAEAAKWYRLAADQGYAQAQYNLGLWYAQGEGGSADNVSAHMWFNLAASRFPPSDARNRGAAVNNRDVLTSKMTSDQIAEAQRLAREWKPK